MAFKINFEGGTVRGKNNPFCHSERGEESLFDLTLRIQSKQIPRFARNDRDGVFSATWVANPSPGFGRERVKPAARYIN
jgi:hypothetical protein